MISLICSTRSNNTKIKYLTNNEETVKQTKAINNKDIRNQNMKKRKHEEMKNPKCSPKNKTGVF